MKWNGNTVEGRLQYGSVIVEFSVKGMKIYLSFKQKWRFPDFSFQKVKWNGNTVEGRLQYGSVIVEFSIKGTKIYISFKLTFIICQLLKEQIHF